MLLLGVSFQILKEDTEAILFEDKLGHDSLQAVIDAIQCMHYTLSINGFY